MTMCAIFFVSGRPQPHFNSNEQNNMAKATIHLLLTRDEACTLVKALNDSLKCNDIWDQDKDKVEMRDQLCAVLDLKHWDL